MKIKFLLLVLLIYINFKAYALNDADLYFENLKKAKKIEYKIKNELPFVYNQMGLGGYFAMPSARSQGAGEVAFSYSNSSPYQILGVNLGYFDHLELSGNFWIFTDLLESNFGKMGYGDDADRAANVKLILLKQKDGFEYLPEIAIGLNDFYGSKRFYSKYIVLTKQFIDQNLESSIGFGAGRIKGIFVAISYFPFIKKQNFFKKTAIFAEYDANNYKNRDEEHPQAKDVNFPINLGLNFSFFDIANLSISSNRGKNVAFGITSHYNLGKSRGLFPKYLDPPLLIDFINSDDSLSENLQSAFKDGGFDLMKISVFVDAKDKKCLSLQIINQRYRDEKIVKMRINNILSNVEIDDYQNILVRVESESLALHEYTFSNKYLKRFKEKKIGDFEFEALSPIDDFCRKENERYEKIVFKNKKMPWNLTVRPKINAFFGACRGKFKYDAGALANLEGFLNNLYYNLQVSYIVKLSSAQVGSRDRYNPSQIIHVRSDFVKYFETNTFHVDNAYVQKNMNLSKKLFGRIALGYFELAYAGIAIEALYYPACFNFAFSIEAANVYKRNFTGLGFQKKIRKWNNTKEEFEKFIGFQYFFNLFLDFKPLDLSLKTSVGRFLAKDRGIKLELFKYFKSGFDISIWTTFTDKIDIVNNKRYFDKGFSITLPLDIFMNKTSRKKVNFKMSEWLRDVGAKAYTGKELYPIVHEERNFY